MQTSVHKHKPLSVAHKPHLRAGPMTRSRWPTQNELNGIFGGFLSHNALSGLFFSLQVFCLYIMVCDFVFLWDLSVGVYVSASVCVSYALSLAPFFCLLLSYSVFVLLPILY